MKIAIVLILLGILIFGFNTTMTMLDIIFVVGCIAFITFGVLAIIGTLQNSEKKEEDREIFITSAIFIAIGVIALIVFMAFALK